MSNPHTGHLYVTFVAMASFILAPSAATPRGLGTSSVGDAQPSCDTRLPLRRCVTGCLESTWNETEKENADY